MLLFLPFRDESQLLLSDETAEVAFQRLMSDQAVEHHQKLQIMLEAQSASKKIEEAREAEIASDKQDEDNCDDEPQLVGEPKCEVIDTTSLVTPIPDKLDLDSRISMLNVDQRRVFDKLRDHFLHEKLHEDSYVIVNSNHFTCL